MFKPKYHYANFVTKSADFVVDFPHAFVRYGLEGLCCFGLCCENTKDGCLQLVFAALVIRASSVDAHQRLPPVT